MLAAHPGRPWRGRIRGRWSSSSATTSTAGRRWRGDRGADRARDDPLPTRFLLGNHDSYVRAYLDDPDWFDRTYHWLHENMGGNATLASMVCRVRTGTGRRRRATAFAHAFPAEHMAFIDACERMIPIGGYLFVHADPARRGARPPGRRRPDLDPRAVPELAGGLRLQGGARPHRRAGGRAPRQPDRRRHRRGAERGAVDGRARGRPRRVVDGEGAEALAGRLRHRRLAQSLAAPPIAAVHPGSRGRAISCSRDFPHTRASGWAMVGPGRGKGMLDEGEIERLLSRCALGDRGAFSRLYELTAPKLYGVSLRILGHRGDAEDAAQEAFVKVWHSAARYQPGRGAPPAGWSPSPATPRSTACGRERRRRATSPTWSTSPIPARRRRRTRRGPTTGGASTAASGCCRPTAPAPCARPMSRGTATTSWRGPSTCRSTPCGPGCVGR